MPLDVAFSFRGCTVNLTSYGERIDLNVSVQLLEHLSADELLELVEWYRKNHNEMCTVYRWQEYDFKPQWREEFTDDDLEVVVASEFSSDDDRRQASSILARRRGVRGAHASKIAQSGYVYLMHSSSGHYKIGASVNPEARLKSLSTASPFAIRLLHVIPASEMFEAEKTLHVRYASKRVNNEWFELSEFDVEAIKQLNRHSGGHFS